MTLDRLPFNQSATIVHVAWEALPERDARRLRELGFDEGVAVTPLHGGGVWTGGRLAVRVGRMTVAIRARHAAQVLVTA